MPKMPRDISGRELANLLKRFGYETTRQTGSHNIERNCELFKDGER
jgi:predicted RNA binding protein YcfA (HicA-like mRNA interferase family)